MIINKRRVQYDCKLMFPKRWSPRSMSGEKITNGQLMAIFEAARWAPSSYNGQPWRFVHAKRGSKHWDRLFNLLNDWNKQWCKNSAVLVVILSRKNFEYNNKPNYHHSFDTGAAWQNMALQGSAMKLVVHGMAGFDFKKAAKDLKVPKGYQIEAMCAIGKRGKKSQLSEELQKSENPNTRKKVKEFAYEGLFKGK